MGCLDGIARLIGGILLIILAAGLSSCCLSFVRRNLLRLTHAAE